MVSREHPCELVGLRVEVDHGLVVEVARSPVSVALGDLSTRLHVEPIEFVLLAEAE